MGTVTVRILAALGLLFYIPGVAKYLLWAGSVHPGDSYWGIFAGLLLIVGAVVLILGGLVWMLVVLTDEAWDA